METWYDEIPLWIWHADTPADLTPIKAAKQNLGITQKVVPFAVSALERPPVDRVLAIGSRPPWVIDYALVTDRTSQAGLERALRWVLGFQDVDDKATTEFDILSSIFPPTEHGRVREISPEELEGEKKMAAYIGATE